MFIVLSAYSCYIFHMTITQTVEIPESRQIFLDLPHDLPVGKAKITVTPQTEKPAAGVYEAATNLRGIAKKMGSTLTVEEALQVAAEKASDPNRKPISRYFGTLSKHTFGDPVAYQRAIRDEWD